jgi:hypothetical protein
MTYLKKQNSFVQQRVFQSDMSAEMLVRGRSRRDGFTITNLHRYRAEIFYVVVDKICVEMNHRFSEEINYKGIIVLLLS